MAAAHTATLLHGGALDVRVAGAKAHDSRTSGTAVTPAGLRVVRAVPKTYPIHEADNAGAKNAGDGRLSAIAGGWSARKDCESAQIGCIKSLTFGVGCKERAVPPTINLNLDLFTRNWETICDAGY